MFTSIKNWLESHSWRSDRGIVRKERRIGRRLVREELKGEHAVNDIDSAFDGGVHQRIHKAFERYIILTNKELSDLKSFVFGYKTLLNRAIENIEKLEQDIKMNAHEDHKQELLQSLQRMEQEILKNYTDFFRALTSFENKNYSVKQLVDRSSQLRDLYYQAIQLRGPVRDLSRWIKREENAERKGKGRDLGQERKSYELALNALRAELSRLSQGWSDCLLLMQELLGDVTRRQEFLEQKAAHDNYPPAWVDQDKTALALVTKPFQEWIDNEIKQSRIFLSDIERAAA